MWFDVNAALAAIEGRDMPAPEVAPLATLATTATPPARVANVASVATRPVRHPEADTPEASPRVASVATSETFPHGLSVGGSPRTWTGRVVSLDEWRHLSAWERHGPNGRLWCGCCRAWVDRETALAHADANRAKWMEQKGE